MRWLLDANGGEKGQGVAQRRRCGYHAQSAGGFVMSCPARRKDAQGAAVFLGRARCQVGQAHPSWQAVCRTNSSASEKKCITFADLMHNLETASFEGF